MSYPINPYRPVTEIVDDFRSISEQQIKIDLGRSVARSIHNEDPKVLLILGLAYCIWLDADLDDDTLSEMAEIMILCGSRVSFPAGGDKQNR